MQRRAILPVASFLIGCNSTPDVDVTGFGEPDTTASMTTGGGDSGNLSEGTAASRGGTAASGDTGSAVLYDVGAADSTGDTAPMPATCEALDPGGNAMPCREHAPPDSFDPEVQWAWDGVDGFKNAVTTPLVANLTDDNGDGTIDLCDTPDVIVVAYSAMPSSLEVVARIAVLSGDDGSLHFMIPTDVDFAVTPAVGDIDGDGMNEIITATGNSILGADGHLIAFEHDGTGPSWTSAEPVGRVSVSGPALADLDADGDVEIVLGDGVYDHLGNQLWIHPGEAPLDINGGIGSIPVAADLDLDGTMEVVHGRSAYKADGSPFYSTTLAPGLAHVANFNADPGPEILLTNAFGLSLIDADGAVLWQINGPRATRAAV